MDVSALTRIFCFPRLLTSCQHILLLHTQRLKGNVIFLWWKNTPIYDSDADILLGTSVKCVAFCQARIQMCDNTKCKRTRWEGGKQTVCEAVFTYFISKWWWSWWKLFLFWGQRVQKETKQTLLFNANGLIHFSLVKKDYSAWRNISNRGLLLCVCVCVCLCVCAREQ